jgi:hypothetical protein
MLGVAPQIFEREVEKITLMYSAEGNVVFPEEDQSLSLPISDFVRMAREKGMMLEAEDVYDPGITYYDHKMPSMMKLARLTCCMWLLPRM